MPCPRHTLPLLVAFALALTVSASPPSPGDALSGGGRAPVRGGAALLASALAARRVPPHAMPARSGSAGPWVPGTAVPSFALRTLDGVFEYNATARNAPLVATVFSRDNAMQDAMWGIDQYVDDLLNNLPLNTNLLFLSYSAHPFGSSAADVVAMRARLRSRLRASHWSPERQEQFLSRCVFAPSPALDLIGTFIPEMLQSWSTSLPFLTFDAGTKVVSKRLDGRWPNIMTPESVFNSTEQLPLRLWSEPCSADSEDLRQQVVLLSIADAQCSLYQQVINAQKSNASAVVFVQKDGASLFDVQCSGVVECNTLVSIPATMVPFTAGWPVIELLLDGMDGVFVSFWHSVSDAMDFSIDGNGQLQEIGNIQYPSFLYYAYAAQFLNYRDQVLANVSVLAEHSLSVSIYNHSIMHGPRAAHVTLPPLEAFSNLVLDLSLGCADTFDQSCPAWDRILSLRVCCDNVEPSLCGFELGRWITPFKRGNGRWLTDVSPLLPLLRDASSSAPPRCTFTIDCGTTEPWAPSLDLHFLTQAAARHPPISAMLALKPRVSREKRVGPATLLAGSPSRIVPLFSNGSRSFNASYNDPPPIAVEVPASATAVLVYAVISGHGSQAHNCAEFCVTSHHFAVNDHPAHNVTFSNAGTQMGCADRVREGVLPNEYGTWLYGRDGWCDGQNVAPLVWDVTSEIVPGQNNTVSYYGWFRGATPAESSGTIHMNSYLAIYEK